MNTSRRRRTPLRRPDGPRRHCRWRRRNGHRDWSAAPRVLPPRCAPWGQRPELLVGVAKAAEVQPRRGIGTLRLKWTVQAVVSGTSGPSLGTEVTESSERADPPYRLTDEVHQPVDVVAGLCQQHRTRTE